MTRFAAALAVTALLALSACGSTPDATNVADRENSAGAALENSAAELEATTDNLTEAEVGNIDAEANGAAVDTAAGNNAAQ